MLCYDHTPPSSDRRLEFVVLCSLCSSSWCKISIRARRILRACVFDVQSAFHSCEVYPGVFKVEFGSGQRRFELAESYVAAENWRSQRIGEGSCRTLWKQTAFTTAEVMRRVCALPIGGTNLHNPRALELQPTPLHHEHTLLLSCIASHGEDGAGSIWQKNCHPRTRLRAHRRKTAHTSSASLYQTYRCPLMETLRMCV